MHQAFALIMLLSLAFALAQGPAPASCEACLKPSMHVVPEFLVCQRLDSLSQ